MLSPVGRSRVETAGVVVPTEKFWTLGLELPIILCIRGVKRRSLCLLSRLVDQEQSFLFFLCAGLHGTVFMVFPTQIGTKMSKVVVNVISSIGEEHLPASTIAIKPNTIDFHGVV